MANNVFEKAKKINPKKFMYAFNIIFILALVAIMTFANLIIDPEHFNFYQWLTSTLILIGIQIPSIILGEMMSKDRSMESFEGQYQLAVRRFKGTEYGWSEKKNEDGRVVDRVDKNGNTIDHIGMQKIKVYFSQFFFWFKAKDSIQKKIGYLESNEFDGQLAERLVKYITIENFEEACSHGIVVIDEETKKEIKIKKITEKQAPFIKEILDGKIDIMENSYSYYLSYDTDKNASMSILEDGPRIEREIAATKTLSRLTKIASHIIFSAIWAMVVVDSASDLGSTQTWLNLISRLSAFTAGLTSGYATSVMVVKMMAAVINKKCDVREMFVISYENKDFVPKSYDQLAAEEAKKEEEERKRKEEEAAKAAKAAIESVVQPEVVPLLENGSSNK